MSDIVISIKNYKLLKDYEQTLPNCRILLVTGKNEIGKSSLIRGIIENITAKSTTDTPLTIGEDEGSKTFTLPDKDGNPIVIHHEFNKENLKGSFYAIDYLGRKIKDVKKIREIIGIFEELPVDTFYTMQQSAEGRRKIIKNYFYPLMEENDINRITEIDSETSKGGKTYDDRSTVNAELGYIQSQLKASQLSHTEKVIADEAESISEELEKLKAQKYSVGEVQQQRSRVTQMIRETESAIAQYPELYTSLKRKYQETISGIEQEIKDLEQMILAKKQKIAQENEKLMESIDKVGKSEQEEITKLRNLKEIVLPEEVDMVAVDTQIEEMQRYAVSALTAKQKKDAYDKYFKSLLEKQAAVEKLEKSINDMKAEKVKIIAKSKLPKGLVIDGDDFTYNGFSFTDSQISKSSALLVIAEILCKINTSKIVYIGEKALFDKDRFKQLVKIAEQHGKIPVLEEVIDNQTEVKILTEIQDA